MNKKELLAAVSKQASVTQKEATMVLEAFIGSITSALKRDDSVRLPGFCSFSMVKRAARNGRNPQTGKAIKIPAATVVKFKAGKQLKDAVNSKKK